MERSPRRRRFAEAVLKKLRMGSIRYPEKCGLSSMLGTGMICSPFLRRWYCAISISFFVAISSMRISLLMIPRRRVFAIFCTIFSDVPRMRMRRREAASMALRTASACPGRTNIARRTAIMRFFSFFAEEPPITFPSLMRMPSSIMASAPFFCATHSAR